MDIDSGGTISTIGYGYVLTLDEGVLSWKYVKKLLLCHDLLCKRKLFFFPMHPDNQIIIFKIFSKKCQWNWHMRTKDKYIRNLITHDIISLDFVRSERNIADLLVKGLMHQQQVFESSREMRL